MFIFSVVTLLHSGFLQLQGTKPIPTGLNTKDFIWLVQKPIAKSCQLRYSWLDPSVKVIKICFLILALFSGKLFPYDSPLEATASLARKGEHFSFDICCRSPRAVLTGMAESLAPLWTWTILLTKLGFRCLLLERGLAWAPHYLD